MSCILLQIRWQHFKCFIVFYTDPTNLLNKQTGFFDKMCQYDHKLQPQFYSYIKVLASNMINCNRKFLHINPMKSNSNHAKAASCLTYNI